MRQTMNLTAWRQASGGRGKNLGAGCWRAARKLGRNRAVERTSRLAMALAMVLLTPATPIFAQSTPTTSESKQTATQSTQTTTQPVGQAPSTPPTITISDVTKAEGNTGKTAFD